MENKTLEEVFQELDVVVKQLENASISLEDSFRLYHTFICQLPFVSIG